MDRRTLAEARTEAFFFLTELGVDPAPSVRVDDRDSVSFYSFKDRKIKVGVKFLSDYNKKRTKLMEDYDSFRERAFACVRGLIAHELGHYFFTRDLEPVYEEARKKGEETPPFPIVNILEDARIEKKMVEERGIDPSLFKVLHETCYAVFYAENKKLSMNPYNVGVLLRWRRWGVDTEIVAMGEIAMALEKLIPDWEEAIDRSERARDTYEVYQIALELYRKWKKFFDSFSPTGMYSPEQGGEGEEDEEVQRRMEGKAEDGEEEETPATGKERPDDGQVSPLDGEIPLYDRETSYDWKEDLIRRESIVLRRYLRKEDEERTYSMCGKRTSPRKLAFPTTEVFKKSVKRPRKKPRVLMIIDHSGSMTGYPIRNARYLARIVEEAGISSLDIVACSTNFCYLLKGTKSLPSLPTGGAEGFVQFSGKIPPHAYDLIFLVTDLCIASDSMETLQELRKVYGEKMIGVYVGSSEDFWHEGADTLGVPFIVKDELEGLARLVGLRLLRVTS